MFGMTRHHVLMGFCMFMVWLTAWTSRDFPTWVGILGQLVLGVALVALVLKLRRAGWLR